MAEHPPRRHGRGREIRLLRRLRDPRGPGLPEGLDGLPGSVLTAFDPEGFVLVDGVAARAAPGSAGLLPGDPVELCYDGAPTKRLLAYRPGEGPQKPGFRAAGNGPA